MVDVSRRIRLGIRNMDFWAIMYDIIVSLSPTIVRIRALHTDDCENIEPE